MKRPTYQQNAVKNAVPLDVMKIDEQVLLNDLEASALRINAHVR